MFHGLYVPWRAWTLAELWPHCASQGQEGAVVNALCDRAFWSLQIWLMLCIPTTGLTAFSYIMEKFLNIIRADLISSPVKFEASTSLSYDS